MELGGYNGQLFGVERLASESALRMRVLVFDWIEWLLFDCLFQLRKLSQKGG